MACIVWKSDKNGQHGTITTADLSCFLRLALVFNLSLSLSNLVDCEWNVRDMFYAYAILYIFKASLVQQWLRCRRHFSCCEVADKKINAIEPFSTGQIIQ